MSEKSVRLSDIRAARRRIRGGVIVTPCPESIPLSEITGARIVCKLDNFQRTGSFKERGARNALLAPAGAGPPLGRRRRLRGQPRPRAGLPRPAPRYTGHGRDAGVRAAHKDHRLPADGGARHPPRRRLRGGARGGGPSGREGGPDLRPWLRRSRHHRRPGHAGPGNPGAGARRGRDRVPGGRRRAAGGPLRGGEVAQAGG